MKKIQQFYPKTSSPCNCTNIRRASRAVTQFYDMVLQPSGLSITQMGLLRSITTSQQVTMSELARKFRIDRTTLNRNLKPLIEAGFIQMERGTDARTRQTVLTDNGERALADACRLWDDAQRMLQDYLGEEDSIHLKKTLSRLEAIVP